MHRTAREGRTSISTRRRWRRNREQRQAWCRSASKTVYYLLESKSTLFAWSLRVIPSRRRAYEHWRERKRSIGPYNSFRCCPLKTLQSRSRRLCALRPHSSHCRWTGYKQRCCRDSKRRPRRSSSPSGSPTLRGTWPAWWWSPAGFAPRLKKFQNRSWLYKWLHTSLMALNLKWRRGLSLIITQKAQNTHTACISQETLSLAAGHWSDFQLSRRYTTHGTVVWHLRLKQRSLGLYEPVYRKEIEDIYGQHQKWSAFHEEKAKNLLVNNGYLRL